MESGHQKAPGVLKEWRGEGGVRRLGVECEGERVRCKKKNSRTETVVVDAGTPPTDPLYDASHPG